MQQEKTTHRPSKRALLYAVSAFVLLGVLAAFGMTANGVGPHAAGLMPEVVSTADRPRLTMNEVIVRAPRPSPDAAVRLSGIN